VSSAVQAEWSRRNNGAMGALKAQIGSKKQGNNDRKFPPRMTLNTVKITRQRVMIPRIALVYRLHISNGTLSMIIYLKEGIQQVQTLHRLRRTCQFNMKTTMTQLPALLQAQMLQTSFARHTLLTLVPLITWSTTHRS
jgi:hypothetical protein